jgi:hypothetical protein
VVSCVSSGPAPVAMPMDALAALVLAFFFLILAVAQLDAAVLSVDVVDVADDIFEGPHAAALVVHPVPRPPAAATPRGRFPLSSLGSNLRLGW